MMDLYKNKKNDLYYILDLKTIIFDSACMLTSFSVGYRYNQRSAFWNKMVVRLKMANLYRKRWGGRLFLYFLTQKIILKVEVQGLYELNDGLIFQLYLCLFPRFLFQLVLIIFMKLRAYFYLFLMFLLAIVLFYSQCLLHYSFLCFCFCYFELESDRETERLKILDDLVIVPRDFSHWVVSNCFEK